MKQIKAKFIGEDSLGYKKGKIYRLEIVKMPINLWPFWPQIRVQRLDKTGTCPYSSKKTFLQNWKVIEEPIYGFDDQDRRVMINQNK